MVSPEYNSMKGPKITTSEPPPTVYNLLTCTQRPVLLPKPITTMEASYIRYL